MSFNAPVFTLRSKVELNLTRSIRPVIAQSVQFSKIAKKLNMDLCQFFSHQKEALSLLKKGVTVLFFAVELQKVRVGRVSKLNVCERGNKVFKKCVYTEFTSRYHI